LWTAQASESQKKKWLKSSLSAWEAQVEDVRAASGEDRWAYREKTCLRAQWNGKAWDLGLRVSTEVRGEYDVVAIPGCPVHSDFVRNAVQTLSHSLPDPKIFCKEGLGEFPLRFLVITGRLVSFVVKMPVPSKDLSFSIEQALLSATRDLGFDGVYINYHPAAGNRVFSSRGWKLIDGRATSVSKAGAVHGPESFQQLIPPLYEDALSQVSSFFQAREGDLVLDFYSGLGLSMRLWAATGAQTRGVELLGEAVKLAGENLKDLPRASLLQGKVSDRLPQIEQWISEWKQDSPGGRLLLFTNPPRLGMEAAVIDWLLKRAKPDRIAYLSCSAGTLSRDLAALCGGNFLGNPAGLAYGVRRIVPYDFFPQTHHVEALACLELDSPHAHTHSSSR
jgi:tRNA/tmRNA/rRNA uracil-C5-methylase (TrmA/RlmC/RlmD family)